MNRIVKVICLATALLSVGSIAQAQFRQSIYLNGNLPTGSFASKVNTTHKNVPLTYEEIGKAANVGFGLGYRASYRFDIGFGEVAPFAQADVFWNTIGGEWGKKYMDAEYTTPSYFNVPVMAGVSYFYTGLWNDITPYGEFGVGADMFIITREGKGVKENNGTLYYAYKPSVTMAWMVGLGAWFGRHVSAGIYYYGLGTHPIDYTSRTLDRNALANAQVELDKSLGNGRQLRTIGSLALRIGFHF